MTCDQCNRTGSVTQECNRCGEQCCEYCLVDGAICKNCYEQHED